MILLDERKDKIRKILIISGILSIVVLYICGIITQFLYKAPGTVDSWNNVKGASKLSFSPVIAIYKGLTQGKNLTLIVLGSIMLVVAFVYINRMKNSNMDERNFKHSDQGTYGTAGWMEEYEKKEVLETNKIEKTTGTILGMDDNGGVLSLPLKSRLNKHTAIYGASGTGKSRCFVRPQILQCSARGESIIVTDPKGEIYADTSSYLKKLGYNVKVFNLVDPQYSDSWNCLGEVSKDESQIELMAQTFCDVVIKNTSGPDSDHFWDSSEMSLLKALCLLVITSESIKKEDKNIGKVYELLTNNDDKKLSAMFDILPPGHPALPSWNIYKKAGDNVRGNIIIGLGSRLQVFQADIIKRITQYDEIDLELPAREKCAYFVIMSDQESTLNFLSSLFFSFLFIRLVKYADIHGKNGACDVPVNFILDEFPNIGQIPDFTKKLSTIRSRDLRVAVIFQNLAQLQNRYPDGLWEEIVGNCDTQLFLGCTDQMTAEFISARTGEITIEVASTAVQRQSIAVVDYIPQYRETSSVGKRFLLTPDEVLRLDNKKALIILRGQKVLKVNKFDYSNHPNASKFETSAVRDYTPLWRERLSEKKEKREQFVKKFEESNNVENIPLSNNVIPDGVEIIKPNNTGGGEPKQPTNPNKPMAPPTKKTKPVTMDAVLNKRKLK